MFYRYSLDEANGWYEVGIPKSTEWVHVVTVYHGVGQGITAYKDGEVVGTDTTKTSGSLPQGSGTLVVGRRVLQNTVYVSALVDEIKLYNCQLSEEEINNLY